MPHVDCNWPMLVFFFVFSFDQGLWLDESVARIEDAEVLLYWSYEAGCRPASLAPEVPIQGQ